MDLVMEHVHFLVIACNNEGKEDAGLRVKAWTPGCALWPRDQALGKQGFQTHWSSPIPPSHLFAANPPTIMLHLTYRKISSDSWQRALEIQELISTILSTSPYFDPETTFPVLRTTSEKQNKPYISNGPDFLRWWTSQTHLINFLSQGLCFLLSSSLHFYLQKIKLENQCLELFRRVGFFSHLLKLLFLEADLVVLLVMPALPEMLGSDVLQLWTLDWRITLKTVGKK